MDGRVVALSAFQNVQQAVSAWINQGFNADYTHVTRPLAQSLGGGGLMQYMDIANHVLGFDNAESRSIARINAENYLRVVGRQLQLDVREGDGGRSNPTPLSPYLTQMELAAYGNDGAAFMEARNNAIRVAGEMGQPDPVDSVKRSYAARNPLRAVFKTPPSEQDYARILSALPDSGRRDVSEAVTLFNRYADSIGATPFEGKREKQPRASNILQLPRLPGVAKARALQAIYR